MVKEVLVSLVKRIRRGLAQNDCGWYLQFTAEERGGNADSRSKESLLGREFRGCGIQIGLI